MKNLSKVKKNKGFTLVEMLIVLFVISILVLLFVPSLSKQKDKVVKNGDEAIIKVVETQKELYTLDASNTDEPTLANLISGGYITAEQEKSYKDAMERKGDG